MENIENVALIDMDGTICDYVGSILGELDRLRGPNEAFVDPFLLKDDINNQYLWERMNLIREDEDWWANLPRLSLGFDVMDIAKGLGYSCEILTQAPRTNPAALSGKLKWLLKNVDENMPFTMTRNKDRHYGKVLVDDFPGYAVPWLKHRPRGLVVMPVNKYNKDFSDKRVVMYDGSNKDEVRERMFGVMKKN